MVNGHLGPALGLIYIAKSKMGSVDWPRLITAWDAYVQLQLCEVGQLCTICLVFCYITEPFGNLQSPLANHERSEWVPVAR